MKSFVLATIIRKINAVTNYKQSEIPVRKNIDQVIEEINRKFSANF